MNEFKSKKLVYIVNLIARGDTQHFVHIPNLLAQLEELGWEIELVSERGGEGVQEVYGRQVHYLSSAGRWSRLLPLARLLLIRRRAGSRLVFVRISRPAGFVSAILGRIFGWKTLFWLSDVKEDYDARQSWHGRVGVVGLWLLFQLVDKLVTGPEAMVDYYSRRYDLPGRKVALLYNDISIAGVQAAQFASGETERVLLVHRLSPTRETSRYLRLLLPALEERALTKRKVTLDVIGGGPEEEVLRQLAHELAPTLDVTFHGPLPNSDLDIHYRMASLFIMPSYREGFPRVLLEAMARGLPIVSTDAGGSRDLFGPLQQRYVVSRDDALGFANGVVDLLSSPKTRMELGRENLSRVRRYATPAVAEMYDRLLSRMLSRA